MSRGRIRIWATGVGALVLAGLWIARNGGPTLSRSTRTSTVSQSTGGVQSSLSQRDRLDVGAAAPTSDSQVAQKLQILEEILASRNDNDPRLDKELKRLSPATKAAMMARYRELQPEARNERGTIVFLIGRELTSLEDAEFLRAVMEETPCLSLRDCSRPDEQPSLQHGSEMDSVTRAYPQWVALESFDRAKSGRMLSGLSQPARVALRMGIESLATRKDVDSKLAHRARGLLGDGS